MVIVSVSIYEIHVEKAKSRHKSVDFITHEIFRKSLKLWTASCIIYDITTIHTVASFKLLEFIISNIKFGCSGLIIHLHVCIYLYVYPLVSIGNRIHI